MVKNYRKVWDIASSCNFNNLWATTASHKFMWVRAMPGRKKTAWCFNWRMDPM